MFQPEQIPEGLSSEEKKKLRTTANTVRQDLHELLLENIPDEQVHMDSKAIDFIVQDGKVTVLFEGTNQVEVDLLIISDGINSVIIPILNT